MKFKVGDKVKVANPKYSFKEHYKNKIFTIKAINPNGTAGYDETHYGVVERCGYIWMESELMSMIDSKIVITTDGKITTAKLYENRQLVKAVEAKCHPEDTFDFNVGAKLAVERLTAPVDEWMVVKRPVKVGDYIRLTFADFSFDKTGDILKVDEVIGTGGGVRIYEKNHPNKPNSFNSDDYWTYSATQYEVVEKVTKEVKETPKYYNGKVVCIDNCNNPSAYTIGKIYQFVDGVITNDCGSKFREVCPVKDFDDWSNWTASKFIEVVE